MRRLEVHHFSEDLTGVEVKAKKGKMKIKPQYDYVSNFTEGMVIVGEGFEQ